MSKLEAPVRASIPRVIVAGRSEKRGYLADGEAFLVGEYEITVHLRREP